MHGYPRAMAVRRWSDGTQMCIFPHSLSPCVCYGIACRRLASFCPLLAVPAILFRLRCLLLFPRTSKVEAQEGEKSVYVERRNAQLACLGVKRAAFIRISAIASSAGVSFLFFLFLFLPPWCLPTRSSVERCCFAVRRARAHEGGPGRRQPDGKYVPDRQFARLQARQAVAVWASSA